MPDMADMRVRFNLDDFSKPMPNDTAGRIKHRLAEVELTVWKWEECIRLARRNLLPALRGWHLWAFVQLLWFYVVSRWKHRRAVRLFSVWAAMVYSLDRELERRREAEYDA